MVSPPLFVGTLICLGMRVWGKDWGNTALVYIKKEEEIMRLLQEFQKRRNEEQRESLAGKGE